MRDIRNDLRDRHASVLARYADEMTEYDENRRKLDERHSQAIAALEKEMLAVKLLLDIEEQRNGATPENAAKAINALKLPLADFLVTKVHTHGPMEKDALRSEAGLAGYIGESDGRTFHTTLMNITTGRKLRKLPDGRYAHPSYEEGLFGLGESKPEEAPMTVM